MALLAEIDKPAFLSRANRERPPCKRQRAGGFAALAVGVEHKAIGDDVRQRVHGVGNQTLRMRHPADDDLHYREDKIDADADPGDAPAFGMAQFGTVPVALMGVFCRVAHARDRYTSRHSTIGAAPIINQGHFPMGCLNQLLTLAQKRANDLNLPYEGALTPAEAHGVLGLVPHARLVDVRTKAELDWVGRIPGAVEIEWQGYPGAVVNSHFLDILKHTVTTDNLLLFICRSGARSSSAAKAASELGFPDCYNVLEGFEGDKDANGQRNNTGGWRAAGLPWHQS